MFKNVASQKLIVYAFDSTNNTPKTGDAANLTAYVSKDYGSVTVLGDTSATEMDSTNAKGYYLFDLTQSETNADTLLFSAKSSTANIVVLGMPATVFTVPANFTSLAVSSAGGVTLADGVSHGGTLGSSTATLALSRLNITSQTSNTDALTVTGNGSGNGASVTGGATGNGGVFSGGATSGGGFVAQATTLGTGASFTGAGAAGAGMRITGADATSTPTAGGKGLIITGGAASTNVAATAGVGMQVNGGSGAASGSGAAAAVQFLAGGTNTVASAAHGLQITGASTGSGVIATSGSGATGNGITATAASTNGNGLALTSTGTGSGFLTDTLKASGAVTLSSTLTVSGATSLAGAVSATNAGNDVRGVTVSAIGSGVITAAAIADGAIDRATFAADTGLVTVRSNTAAAGANGSITLDAGASSTDNFYNDCVVLLTGGTGAGQARLITGYTGSTQVATVAPNWATNPDNTSTFAILPAARVDLSHIVGAAVSTSTAQLGVNVVNFGGSAGTFSSGKPAVTLASTDVTGNVAADLQTIKTQTVTCAGGVTVPAATLASTTNISAGTITTATNVTTVNGLAAGVITASSIAADAITAAKIADGAIDAATFAAGAINAAAIAADAIGASELAADAVAEIADAVWEEAIADHSGTAGSTAEALAAAGSAGDPWNTALPGAYASGKAGYILGTYLDAAVSTRLATSGYTAPLDAAGTRTAVGLASANLDTQLAAIDDYIDTEVAAIKAKTDQLTFGVANTLNAHVTYVNGVRVTGTGAQGDEWGPA